ncbi:hypothetical protein L7F22_040036 [Adiantum nelumboides]|nr:hypothetical protein [Adiantum nelumboides]
MSKAPLYHLNSLLHPGKPTSMLPPHAGGLGEVKGNAASIDYFRTQAVMANKLPPTFSSRVRGLSDQICPNLFLVPPDNNFFNNLPPQGEEMQDFNGRLMGDSHQFANPMFIHGQKGKFSVSTFSLSRRSFLRKRNSMIKTQKLSLSPPLNWKTGFNPKGPKPTKAPVWVDFIDLPVELYPWLNQIRSFVRGVLGQRSRGGINPKFDPQLLIEVDLSQDLIYSVPIQDSNGKILHSQKVVYKTLPNACYNCMKVGHFIKDCLDFKPQPRPIENGPEKKEEFQNVPNKFVPRYNKGNKSSSSRVKNSFSPLLEDVFDPFVYENNVLYQQGKNSQDLGATTVEDPLLNKETAQNEDLTQKLSKEPIPNSQEKVSTLSSDSSFDKESKAIPNTQLEANMELEEELFAAQLQAHDNKVTVKNNYPLPRIDKLLDRLHGSKVFTKIDLRSATLNRLMQDIFRPYLDDFILVFFDNILVYSKNETDHEDHLRKVLNILREHTLYAKLSKCTFFSPKIEYLGFILSEDGISVDPAKVQDIVDWPVPTNPSELRGFLGITGWYRTFIKGYATIAAPLTNLLKKGVKINWKPKHQENFDDLKQYVTTTSCLKLPDFDQPFEVVTDASGIAIGGVLIQEGRPVAFTSRKLRIHERNYPTHDLELLAIVHALKLWRHYLLGRRFQLVTDHKSLKWIFTQPTLNIRQRHWIELLQEYDFESTNTRVLLQEYDYKSTTTRVLLQEYDYKSTTTRVRLSSFLRWGYLEKI